jgi:MFS transporter, PPP family, 3-phenylpropionic acid transporter
MAAQPQKSTGEQFSLRLKAFYAALFLTLGVQLPFLPLWLTAKGLDAGSIGIVLAIPAVIRIVAIPVATRMADRRDAVRGVIVLASAAAAAGFGALAFAQGAAAIMLVYALASAAYAPVMMLADTYALRGLAQRGRAYGPVRLWGSAAFIAASFGAGALLDWMAPVDLIWLMVGAMAIATAAALALVPLGAEPAGGAPVRGSATGLLRNPAFLAAIAAASLVQASHALYYGFSTIDWQAAGYDGGVIGALWALGVISEIALFALSARLPSTITPLAMLLAGAAGAVLRWSAMAAAPPAVLLPVLQCLHALSFGATHLGALALVARMAPPGLGATAQGYFAVAHGVTMAVATALAGVLYGRFGSSAYAAMAALAAAGGLCALAAKRAQQSLSRE